MSSSEQGRTSSGRPLSPLSLPSSKSGKADASKLKKKKGKQTILSTAHPSPSNGSGSSTGAMSGISAAQSANTPCRFFQLGQCNKGNQCPFLHKKAAHFSPQACKFYSNGYCRNADTCPFSHDPKILEAASTNGGVKDPSMVMPGEYLADGPDNMAGGNGMTSEAHSGDFGGLHGESAGSLDLPLFPAGSSLSDSYLLPDDVGSPYNDTPFSTISGSSSYDEEGLAGPVDHHSVISGGEPFSLYPGLSSSMPTPYSQAQHSSNPSLSGSSGLTSSQPSSTQLHQLLHPSSSPRGILTKRSSSEYLSSSYSSGSTPSSESSSPGMTNINPMHGAVSPVTPGSLKLRQTGHISTTTFTTLPTPTLTPPPASQGGVRSPSYSPRSNDSTTSSSVASGHVTPGLNSSSDVLSSGPPHPFRRQSSVQLASTSTKTSHSSITNFTSSYLGSNPSTSTISGPNMGSMPSPQQGAPGSFGGRAPGFGSGPGVGGRPAPFNRSRSTDQGILPSRINGFGSSAVGSMFPEDFQFDRTTPSPSMGPFFTRSGNSGSVPPLVTNLLLDTRSDTDHNAGSITPTSTSSSVMDQSSLNVISPRSRRPSVSSGAPLVSSSSYLGSDLESYSELGSSDEEDVYFWGDPTAFKRSSTATPTVHHKFIEGLLEDDEVVPLPTSASYNSIATFTESVKANRRASSGAMKPSPSSSTLSPSASKSSFGSSGGHPIPMLSRTRKGSFSKSHEDLLANREANLQSPSLFTSSSVSGLGFSALLAQGGGAAGVAASAAGAHDESAPTTPTSSSYSRSSTINSATSSTTGGTTATTNTSSSGAIPPKLGSLKSQSSVRLVHPSSSLQGPPSLLSSGIPGSMAGGPGILGSGRVPPKLSKIGKSQSETGPAIASSILAWKEKRAAEVLVSTTLPHPAPSDLRIATAKAAASAAADPSGTSSQLASPSSTASSTASRKQQLCMFYIDGACRYGDACKFVHGLVCTMCKKPCLFPDDAQQNEKHAKSCRLKIEIEESKDLSCALCKLKVVESNRKFGLLPDCNDVICVPCLKEYRTSTSRAECPVCQAPSHFLIPSHSFPQNPDRKKELTEAFKLKMSKIACKYFDYGNGVCKYGQNCHFHHNMEPGAGPSSSSASTHPTASTAPSVHTAEVESSSVDGVAPQ